MSLPDWNNNDQRDLLDIYIDMNNIEESNKSDKYKYSNSNAKTKTNTNKDTNKNPITNNQSSELKKICGILICIVGIILPMKVDLGIVGTFICILCGIGIALDFF